MTDIPRPALLLGLAGVLPFAACVLGSWFWPAGPLNEGWELLQFTYALTILSFMSGCIWAFALKTEDVTGYALSTVPALYGFGLVAVIFFGLTSIANSLLLIALGFLGLLALDRRAFQLGQTPNWWMQLRLLLTGLVVITLALGAFT